MEPSGAAEVNGVGCTAARVHPITPGRPFQSLYGPLAGG